MGIGKRIKEARERLGLTQCQLADKIGVTPSAITNYEKETSHPKEQVLYKLIDALGVDANYLFQDCVHNDESQNEISESIQEKTYSQQDFEKTVKILTDFFVQCGYIKPGEDISDEQLKVAIDVVDYLNLYFSKHEKDENK